MMKIIFKLIRVGAQERDNENNPEYQLYKQVSTYLRYRTLVIVHFDPTGLNLSKAQSGMLRQFSVIKVS